MVKVTFELEDADTAARFMAQYSTFMAAKDTPEAVCENGPTQKEEPKEEPKQEDEPAGESPKPTGRRRGRPAKDPEAKPAGRRAGRPRKEEEPVEEQADISDADASKAASEAAKELGVEAVLSLLKEFKVAKVSELTQPQRKSFLSELRDLLNAESLDGPAF